MFAIDGTIGEFVELSRIAQENRRLAQEMADSSSGGLLGRAVAGATLQMRDLTAGAAPVDTGTLRSAHRAEFRPYGDGMEGIVEIDPHAVNPVNNHRPAYYGEIWADKRFNWFEKVADQHAEGILDRMEQVIVTRVDAVWR